MKSSKTFLVFLTFIIGVLFSSGCDFLSTERNVNMTFRKLVMALQDKDYEAIENLIHSQSPFIAATNSREARNRIWTFQSFKLSSVGGEIETLNTKNKSGKRVLTYRIRPGNMQYGLVESSLSFLKENGKWKLWIPKEGVDVIPVEIGNIEREGTYINEFENSEGTIFQVQSKKVSGMKKDDWLKKLREESEQKKKDIRKQSTLDKSLHSTQ